MPSPQPKSTTVRPGWMPIDCSIVFPVVCSQFVIGSVVLLMGVCIIFFYSYLVVWLVLQELIFVCFDL